MEQLDNIEKDEKSIKTTLLFILVIIVGFIDLIFAIFFIINIINNQNKQTTITKTYDDTYTAIAIPNIDNNDSSSYKSYVSTAKFSNLTINNEYEVIIQFKNTNTDEYIKFNNEILTCKFKFNPTTTDGSIKITFDLPKNIFNNIVFEQCISIKQL